MTMSAMLTIGLIGLFAGGIINYIACLLIRTDDPLSNYTPSDDCLHKISLWEAIPFMSFCFPARKCPHCRNRLFLAYPLVEIITAGFFMALVWRLGFTANAAGMMILVSVLIAVCITDFRVKIIPHEITYPAIILGIIFSAQIRSDLLGALAGIGISYIVFDFLAFYGLQFYIWMNKPTSIASAQLLSTTENSPRSKQTNLIFWYSNSFTLKQKQTSSIAPLSNLFCKGTPIEELEIIGGGDAVLSALISSWLGWRKLLLALIVSFIVGAVLGALYLLVELWRQRLIKTLVLPVTTYILAIALLAKFLLYLLAQILQQPGLNSMYLTVLPWAIFIGLLLGIMTAGSKLSKPFPFGPALAAGAVAAIFT
jgi:prepilin signal peptidase PulO-like enzyme (type II secretory pathway)